jgi:hypothetical protein
VDPRRGRRSLPRLFLAQSAPYAVVGCAVLSVRYSELARCASASCQRRPLRPPARPGQ